MALATQGERGIERKAVAMIIPETISLHGFETVLLAAIGVLLVAGSALLWFATKPPKQ